MPPNHILCLARYPRATNVLRLQLETMFSDESLDAFRSATEDGDFEPLSRIFKGDHFMSIKCQIFLLKNAMPDAFLSSNEREL